MVVVGGSVAFVEEEVVGVVVASVVVVEVVVVVVTLVVEVGEVVVVGVVVVLGVVVGVVVVVVLVVVLVVVVVVVVAGVVVVEVEVVVGSGGLQVFKHWKNLPPFFMHWSMQFPQGPLTLLGQSQTFSAGLKT